jgi:hypothetical protein
MSRNEVWFLMGVVMVIGGLPLLFQADGLGEGDPVLARAYSFVGLGLAAIGLTTLLTMAARRWPSSARSQVARPRE